MISRRTRVRAAALTRAKTRYSNDTNAESNVRAGAGGAGRRKGENQKYRRRRELRAQETEGCVHESAREQLKKYKTVRFMMRATIVAEWNDALSSASAHARGCVQEEGREDP